MTKTIEFVERKIKDKKDQLKRLKNLKTISNKYELQINELLRKNTEEDIEYLQQIKCILEAWKVVKPSISEEHLEDCQIRTMYGENPFMNVLQEEATKVKKALEVENG